MTVTVCISWGSVMSQSLQITQRVLKMFHYVFLKFLLNYETRFDIFHSFRSLCLTAVVCR